MYLKSVKPVIYIYGLSGDLFTINGRSHGPFIHTSVNMFKKIYAAVINILHYFINNRSLNPVDNITCVIIEKYIREFKRKNE